SNWLATLNIPWATSGRYNSAYWGGWGAVFDDQVSKLKQAIKARMPTQAPSDALTPLGDERQIDRGPTESDQAYALRLRGAWEAWARAGTPLGLLLALYYAGFPGAVVVQQNGLAYALSTPLAADPTQSLILTTLGTNPNITSVPPWWLFDFNNPF